LFNFGNADYAPLIQWDVSPPEDAKMQSEVFKNFADALYVMRRGGIQVNDIEGLAKSFGLNMSLADIQMVDPLSGGMGPSA
jgi:hypothetical protein